MSEVHIQPIQTLHYADYVALIGKQLGEGYLTEADFREMAADDQAIFLEAVNGQNDVLGVLTAIIRARQEALNLLKMLPENLSDYAVQSELIGILKPLPSAKQLKGTA